MSIQSRGGPPLLPEITAATIESYLHEHIPLSGAMGVQVREYDAAGAVRLWAPIAPNINHRQTVFGGSAATLATLAAWSLVHFRLRAETPEEEQQWRVVVRHSTIEYPRPLIGNFEAMSPPPDAAEWNRFVETLRRRGRARITITAEVTAAGKVGAIFTGEFVALRPTS